MNYLITILITAITTLVLNFATPIPTVWDNPSLQLGTTNYPTSLDTLTNPSGTDSVATVSHSAQHSNANDALEALQAKLGIGASTAVTNSIFVGNGTGSSIFTTTPTSTTYYATGLGTFGGLLSTASSTIIGGLHITGNSTTTNATSTIGAFTSYATSTQYYGAGLTSCSGSNFLQWANGSFGCQSISSDAALGFASSTPPGGSWPTDYKAKTFSATAGQTILWWGQCSRSGANTITAGYKTSNDSSTTTVNSASIASAEDLTTIQGFFHATTTYNVTVQVTTTGCDQEMGLFMSAILLTTST